MSELYIRKEIERVTNEIKEDIEPNIGQVGDVVQSVLTEAQVQSLRGSGWVLMDGRDVTGSTYASITGNTTIPDGRGQFLRGKNNGRNDGNEDVDGERNLGSQQGDAFQGHEHRVNLRATGTGAGAGAPYPDAVDENTIGIVQKPGFSVPRVADETRPKNIAINYFIKIN